MELGLVFRLPCECVPVLPRALAVALPFVVAWLFELLQLSLVPSYGRLSKMRPGLPRYFLQCLLGSPVASWLQSGVLALLVAPDLLLCFRVQLEPRNLHLWKQEAAAEVAD